MKTMVESEWDGAIRRDSHGGYYIRMPKRTVKRLMHRAGLKDHYDGWPVRVKTLYGGPDE